MEEVSKAAREERSVCIIGVHTSVISLSAAMSSSCHHVITYIIPDKAGPCVPTTGPLGRYLMT